MKTEKSVFNNLLLTHPKPKNLNQKQRRLFHSIQIWNIAILEDKSGDHESLHGSRFCLTHDDPNLAGTSICSFLRIPPKDKSEEVKKKYD